MEPYPGRLEVHYPESLSRLSTVLRLPLVLALLPLAIAMAVVAWAAALGGWLAILATGRYPLWLHRAGSEAAGWFARYLAFSFLLTDRLPGLDPNDAVEFDAGPIPLGPSRRRVLAWRVLLLPVHLLLLHLLLIFGMTVVLALAWAAILLTGRFPQGMFGFVVGYLRWLSRIWPYWASWTDRFPPFSFSGQAGPAESASAGASGIFGLLLGAAVVATVVVPDPGPQVVAADYAALQQGIPSETERINRSNLSAPRDFTLTLEEIADPSPAFQQAFEPRPGERALSFEWTLHEIRGGTSVSSKAARLSARVGDDVLTFRPVLITVNGQPAPGDVDRTATVVAGFVVPESAVVTSVTFRPNISNDGGIKYDFEAD